MIHLYRSISSSQIMLTSPHSNADSDASHVKLNTRHTIDDDTDESDTRSCTNSIIGRSSKSISASYSMDISQEQIDHMHDAFAIFDKDMTGSITIEQFK
jgi:hypothetical protein